MAPLPSTRALGSLLAALLLCCCSQMAAAQWQRNFVLRPVPDMVASPAPRLEIRDLLGDFRMRTLYIRALINMQDRENSRLDSYTALAGIHGAGAPYDGVSRGNGGSGYCVHGSPFFPPWHKPFLSIIEQALYEEANRVAAGYDATWQATARRIRSPFWDWARAGGEVPEILRPTTTQVDVILPNGRPTTVRNPLVTYTIPTDAVTRYGIGNNYVTIARAPNWVATYQNLVRQLRSETLSMFQATTWACFVNNVGSCTNIGSLEGTHNRVHVAIGGDNGHMTRINYAAYDPIFWLHHTNVDRFLAIWETLNPTTTMGTIVDRSAFPFRRAISSRGTVSWWRTRDLMLAYTRQTTRAQWGYYYQDTENTNLRGLVNTLYNDAPGQAITFASVQGTNTAQLDASASLSLAATTTTTAPAPAATRRARAGKPGKTTRRVRRTVQVQAGNVRLVRARTRAGRFSVSRVNVDITDALQKLKDANPGGLTAVTVVATVTPTNSSTNNAAANDRADSAAANLPPQIDLGPVMISTLIDGVVVATNAPVPPTTAVRLKDTPVAADVNLFAKGNVTAEVTP